MQGGAAGLLGQMNPVPWPRGGSLRTVHRVDLTIIGGGPVGLFASFYAGMRGLSVRIIDTLPDLGGQLMALYPEKYVYDMPGFPSILAKDLAAGLSEQGTQFKADVVLGVRADMLLADREGYVIGGSNGISYPTRKVVISAGAGAFSPTKIGLPEEDSYVDKGLSYGVRSKADFEGRKVAIVGGGDSAFDWALNLHPVARELVIVHRRDQFRAHEETVKEVRNLGVAFRLWKTVKQIHGDDWMTGVTLEDTQSREVEFLDCDALVVNIGYKSSLGPIKDWGVEIEKNQIVVDHLYQTRMPGVFAVGDVCTYDGKLKLIATGVGEAVTAVCVAKTLLDPTAKMFPGHSSDMDQFGSSG